VEAEDETRVSVPVLDQSDVAVGLTPTWLERTAWRHGRQVWQAAQVAIRANYQKTVIGWWWLLLRPLAPAISSTVVMGAFVGVKTGDTPYFLFVLCGLAIWHLFEAGLLASTRSLRLIKRLGGPGAFPLVLLPVAGMVPRLVDFGVTVVLVLVVNIGFFVAHGRSYLVLGWETLLSLPAVLLCLLLVVGLGFFTSVLIGNKRDLRFGLHQVLRGWFFLTPVVYPLHLVPPRWRFIASFNPMTTIVEMFKRGLLGNKEHGDLGHFMVTIPLVGLIVVAGLWFFRSRRPAVPDEDATFDGEDDDE
jgi:lipopolysaccharide transport system permease protein